MTKETADHWMEEKILERMDAPEREQARTNAPAEIERLAKLPKLDYELEREAVAKRLGIGVTRLDEIVKEARGRAKGQTNFLAHWHAEPWPEAVDGAALLKDLQAHIKRFAVLPKHADVALALWVLLTWVFDCFDITPYLAITSPTRRCGKTLLMTLLYWLCCRAKKNDSMSKAAIYRSVDRDKPTLVLDEVGWVVDLSDERQNILCGGFERNGYAETCEGEGANITTRLWSTFCPKAFGLIGKLTPTLMDRSIEIPMQRKLYEKVERLRRRDNEEHAALREKCLRWAQDNAKLLPTTPALPSGLNDRAIDCWEPLLAVAQHIGGDWPKLTTDAAIALSGGGNGSEERSVELLADIKTAFAEKTALTTKTLIAALCADEERPWATWNKGKPISDRQVAKLLSPFPILSETVHPYETGEAKDGKGYKRDRFADAFKRYLTPSAQIRSPEASYRPNADEMDTTSDFFIRPESEKDGYEKCEKPANHGERDARTASESKTGTEKPFDQREGSNGSAPFRSDIADAYAELSLRADEAGQLPTTSGPPDVVAMFMRDMALRSS